uniref:Cytosolic acyl coenzyme A thioester hydrolase n=1 Tax=Sphaerodactylus townsendi TaxID=933632 RepID=A0ACB8EE90_9SAUR
MQRAGGSGGTAATMSRTGPGAIQISSSPPLCFPSGVILERKTRELLIFSAESEFPLFFRSAVAKAMLKAGLRLRGFWKGVKLLQVNAKLGRIMCPDDANIAGNVHGGTILKMIEEAGAIISTRHCNSQSGERCVAALARVERMDFLSPMCIGDVAHVSAEITYTSKHSVEVQVNVVSENIFTGAKKVTDQATLWYVPLALQNVHKVLEVPPIQYAGTEQEEEGRRRYEEQKLERLETKERNGDVILPVINPGKKKERPSERLY